MPKQLTAQEKAEAAIAELRTLTREAHEAAQLLEARKREVLALYEEAMKVTVAIREAAVKEVAPIIKDLTTAVSAKAEDYFKEIVDKFADALEAQNEVWDEQIRKKYGLPERAVVIDIRSGREGIFAPGSPEAAEHLSDAQHRIVINPT